jgi:hypothetical protein
MVTTNLEKVFGPWHLQRNGEYIENFGALVESEQLKRLRSSLRWWR